VAVVREIWRYPFKSMAGERLPQVDIGTAGLADDRRFAAVDVDVERGWPLSAREAHRLLRYRARVGPAGAVVETPSGALLAAASPELEAELQTATGRRLRIVDSPGENFDDSHLVLVAEASLQAYAREVGTALDRRRFRANLYLEDLGPFEELRWSGRHLRAGNAMLLATEPCERCVIITIDPSSGHRRPDLLRTLVRDHRGLMGMRCQVLQPGTVSEGEFCGPL
jgi:uncharacterized protein